jgi:exonuclease SbcD
VLAIFALLGGRFGVHVADRIEQVGLTSDGRWIVSDAWHFDRLPPGLLALFSCVPTVNRAVVAATVGAAAAAPTVGERLSDLLQGFAPTHRAARAAGVPSLGVSHGTVFGCLSEHGVPMAGFDHEFTTGALFAAEAQAFLLGHIHRHQAWRREGPAGRQCIAYPGSIGRYHHGEDGDKGVLVWQVDADGADCTLHTTPARRTIDICFEGTPELGSLREAVARQDVAGAFVRVRWTVAEEDRHEVDRAAIVRILDGAAEVKLEGRIVPVQRTRAAGIARLHSLADKVRNRVTA